MNPRPLFILSSVILATSALAADKITYNDQVLPLLKNACLNCHNPDKKKAGLDLSTYQAALAGSDNGKVVESGNAASSLLIKCVKQTDDPKMPPKGDKLSDADIAILEKWVTGQLLETANGKAVVASNNVQVAVVSLTKPDGPPPMPTIDLPLEPLVRTKTTNALVALAASPWAPLVAIGGEQQITLYNTDTLQAVGVLPFPEGFPTVVRFSRNGQLLMTGGGQGGKSGKVVLWKVATGERAGSVGNEFDQVLGADLSPDQTHVALGGPTKVLKIYSTKDGKLEQSIKKHTDWITAVTYSPDGKYLASADRSGGIVVWEGSTGKEFNTLPGHKLMVTALAFMPGVLASASEDGKISLWDVKEGKEIRSWTAHAGGVMSVDFTPDGRIVSSGRDKVAKVWDQNGKVLLTSEPFNDIALRAVLSNERVVAGDYTGQIRVINLADSKRLGELTANPPTIEESLAAAQKTAADAKAKQAPLDAALADAKSKLAAAQAELEPKRKADLAALEQQGQAAQAELEKVKAAHQQLEAQLQTQRQAFEAQVKARNAAAEADRAALEPKVDEEMKKVSVLEASVKQSHDAMVAGNPALEKRLADANAALVDLKKAPLKLSPGEGKLAKITQLETQRKALVGEVETQRAARDKVPAGTPARKDADAKIMAKKVELEKTETALAEAQKAATTSPQEDALAQAQGAAEQNGALLASATADHEHWQRAQAFMGVHRARQSLVDLTDKCEGLNAAAKDALAPADKIQADIAAGEKTAADTAAAARAKADELAKTQAERDAAHKALTALETKSGDLATQQKTAQAALAKVTADIAAATKVLEPKKAALAKLDEEAAKFPAGSPDRGVADAKAQAPRAEVARLQTALDALQATLASTKTRAESLTRDAADALAALNPPREAAKTADAKATAAAPAAEAAKKAADAEVAKLAELKQKAPAVIAEAKAAQSKAQQEAAAAAKDLEAVKVQAERTRNEFNTRYRADIQPVKLGQPLASK